MGAIIRLLKWMFHKPYWKAPNEQQAYERYYRNFPLDDPRD